MVYPGRSIGWNLNVTLNWSEMRLIPDNLFIGCGILFEINNNPPHGVIRSTGLRAEEGAFFVTNIVNTNGHITRLCAGNDLGTSYHFDFEMDGTCSRAEYTENGNPNQTTRFGNPNARTALYVAGDYRPETPEEQDARLAANAERARANQLALEQRRAQRAAALGRSRDLLLKILNPLQREIFERDGVIHVAASNGVWYMIVPRESYNIYRRTDVASWTRYCALPKGDLPLYDIMLGQYLTLKTNAGEILNRANTDPQCKPYYKPDGTELPGILCPVSINPRKMVANVRVVEETTIGNNDAWTAAYGRAWGVNLGFTGMVVHPETHAQIYDAAAQGLQQAQHFAEAANALFQALGQAAEVFNRMLEITGITLNQFFYAYPELVRLAITNPEGAIQRISHLCRTRNYGQVEAEYQVRMVDLLGEQRARPREPPQVTLSQYWGTQRPLPHPPQNYFVVD